MKPIFTQLLTSRIAKRTDKSPKRTGRYLNFELNGPFSVDGDGYLRGSPAEQAAQMEVPASEDEMIANEFAEAEVSPEVAAAIEEARADYQDDLELQKARAKAKARQREEAEEFVRQEQDAGVQSGEFDQWDADSRRDSPERPAARASAKPKLKVKGKRSFVRRMVGLFWRAVSRSSKARLSIDIGASRSESPRSTLPSAKSERKANVQINTKVYQ